MNMDGYALVVGTSMEPVFHSGELLPVTKQKENAKTGSVVVVNGAGHIFIHRIVLRLGEWYLVKGDNNLHFDGIFNTNQIVCIIRYGYSRKISFYSLIEGLWRSTFGCFWIDKHFHEILQKKYKKLIKEIKEEIN